MFPEIRHLSINVQNPKRCSRILAELTQGKSQEFKAKNLKGAWVTIWDESKNQLIEFLPLGYRLKPSKDGVIFEKTSHLIPSGQHIQIFTPEKLKIIQTLGEDEGCFHMARLDVRKGGPLYEFWIEESFLVELVSEEISKLA